MKRLKDESGYVSGVSVRAATNDFRIVGNAAALDYEYAKLKDLIEETFQLNNGSKPVLTKFRSSKKITLTKFFVKCPSVLCVSQAQNVTKKKSQTNLYIYRTRYHNFDLKLLLCPHLIIAIPGTRRSLPYRTVLWCTVI